MFKADIQYKSVQIHNLKMSDLILKLCVFASVFCYGNFLENNIYFPPYSVHISNVKITYIFPIFCTHF